MIRFLEGLHSDSTLDLSD